MPFMSFNCLNIPIFCPLQLMSGRAAYAPINGYSRRRRRDATTARMGEARKVTNMYTCCVAVISVTP